MPNTAGAGAIGLFASLRRLLANLLELGQVRLSLLAVEYEQEKQRVFDALAWGLGALVMLAAGVLMLSALLVLLVPEPWRLITLMLLTALYLALGVWMAATARRSLAAPSKLHGALTTTIAEIASDRASLLPPERLP